MKSRIVLHATLAAILVGGGFLGWHVLHSDGTPTTSSSSIVAASKGNVLTTVSASGNVTSAAEQSLSFPTSGTVTSISVAVGDHVTAGQQLAQIDDTSTLGALATAKAALETAEDNYTAVANGTAQGNGTGTGTSSAAASTAATASKSSASGGSSSGGQSSYDQAVASADQAISAAESKLNSANATLTTDQAALIAAQKQLNTDQAGGASPSAIEADSAKVNSLTQKVSDDQAAVSGATSALASTTLQSNQQTAAALKSASASSATSNQAVAQTTTTTTVPPTSAQLDTAFAKVLSARADAATALQNEADTILRAPADGTVAAINGTVGELSGSSSSSTSSGSSAASSGSGSGLGSGAGSGAASSAASSSSSSSSSSAFMTLVDLNNYQVSVPFTEADSIGVKQGAAATLSVSAISKTFTGKVTAVGLIGTTSNSVVNYNATVTFDPGQDVSEVKPGMTTQVSIVTQKADAVVTLPSADVTTTGTRTTLNVVGPNGKTQARLVSIGLRGDDNVEISSGLSAGEKVKITRTSSASTAATGATGFGGGGFGGGGLGGGLGGGGFRRTGGAGGGATGGGAGG